MQKKFFFPLWGQVTWDLEFFTKKSKIETFRILCHFFRVWVTGSVRYRILCKYKMGRSICNRFKVPEKSHFCIISIIRRQKGPMFHYCLQIQYIFQKWLNMDETHRKWSFGDCLVNFGAFLRFCPNYCLGMPYFENRKFWTFARKWLYRFCSFCIFR